MSKEQLHCHYSDLPSPMAYMRMKEDPIDYDGMGNQGRIPNLKQKESFTMKRFIEKLLLWWSFKKPKRSKKSIWTL
jgi:hypothetical protein